MALYYLSPVAELYSATIDSPTVALADFLEKSARYLDCRLIQPRALWGRITGALVPVRVRRGIVAIRTGETTIAAIVQIAEAPRRTHAGRVVEIEGRAYRAHL